MVKSNTIIFGALALWLVSQYGLGLVNIPNPLSSSTSTFPVGPSYQIKGIRSASTMGSTPTSMIVPIIQKDGVNQISMPPARPLASPGTSYSYNPSYATMSSDGGSNVSALPPLTVPQPNKDAITRSTSIYKGVFDKFTDPTRQTSVFAPEPQSIAMARMAGRDGLGAYTPPVQEAIKDTYLSYTRM